MTLDTTMTVSAYGQLWHTPDRFCAGKAGHLTILDAVAAGDAELTASAGAPR